MTTDQATSVPDRNARAESTAFIALERLNLDDTPGAVPPFVAGRSRVICKPPRAVIAAAPRLPHLQSRLHF
jgi:hypothetical protein